MDDIGIQPPEIDNSQLIEEHTILKYNVPLTRPNWYLRFFIPVEGSNYSRHKCVECGFEGMAPLYALTNLHRHFTAKKYKECGVKYDSWKIQHGGKNAVSKEISRHHNYKTCSKGLQSDDIDDKLGDLFISAELPFTFVKLEEFATFCAALNPHYTVPSIFKLKNRILKNKYIEGDKSLRDQLNNNPFNIITIDGWSSRRLISMMGIIVHYYVETIPKSSVLSMEMFKHGFNGSTGVIGYADAKYGIVKIQLTNMFPNRRPKAREQIQNVCHQRSASKRSVLVY